MKKASLNLLYSSEKFHVNHKRTVLIKVQDKNKLNYGEIEKKNHSKCHLIICALNDIRSQILFYIYNVKLNLQLKSEIQIKYELLRCQKWKKSKSFLLNAILLLLYLRGP